MRLSDDFPENASFISLARLFALHLDFNIPEYQRGYRWTKDQVKTLINDIEDFSPIEESEFYSVQPLVVQRCKGGGCFDVIDGQQRLTTLYILLKACGSFNEDTRFSINYSTRNGDENHTGSHEFLEHIDDSAFKLKGDSDNNIDFEHMREAFKESKRWANAKSDLQSFVDKLLNRVKFLWYDIEDADPIEVFTRLNVDKIPLTGAELIKAKFLKSEHGDFAITQNRAVVWDQIERQLNDDRFWYFLNREHMCSEDRIFWLLKLAFNSSSEDGLDLQLAHRKLYEEVSTAIAKDSSSAWRIVDETYWMLIDWYNDIEFYHYIGYLIHCDEGGQSLILDLKNEWLSLHGGRSNFKEFLHGKIRLTLRAQMDEEGRIDLWKEYEKDGKTPKTQCRNLLLLHNIMSTIKANQRQLSEFDVGGVFYKFPFNLFEAEEWNIEHIDSNTANDLKDKDAQRDWLRCVLYAGILPEDDNRVREALQEQSTSDFGLLIKQLETCISNVANNRGVKLLSETASDAREPEKVVNEKNFVWNYALLDEKTNKGYGNAIFAAKRRILIGKTRGIKYVWKQHEMRFGEEHAASAFVPCCTLNVFLKYYSADANSLMFWGVDDAAGYLNCIRDSLKDIAGISFRPNARDEELING